MLKTEFSAKCLNAVESLIGYNLVPAAQVVNLLEELLLLLLLLLGKILEKVEQPTSNQ